MAIDPPEPQPPFQPDSPLLIVSVVLLASLPSVSPSSLARPSLVVRGDGRDVLHRRLNGSPRLVAIAVHCRQPCQRSPAPRRRRRAT